MRVCWARHPWRDGAASEQRPLHRMATAAAQRGGGGREEGARRDSKQEIAAKSLGGRASEAIEDTAEDASRKKENPDGRKAATHPPSLPRYFCGRGRLRPFLSFLRAFPSFIRNGPFHSERERAGLDVAQALLAMPRYTDDVRRRRSEIWRDIKQLVDLLE